MKRLLIIIAVLMLAGCSTPLGRSAQKTFHMATLGLVNDPDVSEATKVEIVSQQADLAASRASEELRFKTFAPYHRIALITFMLGLSISVMSRIQIPALSFLTKGMWKVGAWVMAGAGILSAYATLMADIAVIHYLGWAIGIIGVCAIAFLIVRLIINQKNQESF